MDSQTQGQNPRELGETIVPTIDVENYLFASKNIEIVNAQSQPVFAIGSFTPQFTVPQDEIWHVRAVAGALLNVDVANILGMRYSVGISPVGNEYLPVATMIGATTILVNQQLGITALMAKWLQLLPGWRVGILMESGSAPGLAPVHLVQLYRGILKI